MLDDLPPRERDVWTLTVEGLSPDQIAERLEMKRNPSTRPSTAGG